MNFHTFEELQNTRESCRVYSDAPVSRELLTHLADVARLSPSACNSQPWHFLIVDEPEAKKRLTECLEDGGLNGCPWGNRVPAFFIICEEKAKLQPGVAEHYGSQHFAQMLRGRFPGTRNLYDRHHEPGTAAQCLSYSF